MMKDGSFRKSTSDDDQRDVKESKYNTEKNGRGIEW